ncbi:hypothetical protein BASA81_000052 [Batrachochytrium salamandrivorans]|nr:hypothetical protein BASA81_000052 [Batrachochytrium salamandrivorans]
MEPSLEANRKLLFMNKRKTEVLIRMASLGAQEEDLAFLRDLFSSSAALSAPSSLINSPSPLRRNSLVDFVPQTPPKSASGVQPPSSLLLPTTSKEYTDLMSYFQIEYAPSAKSSRLPRSTKLGEGMEDGGEPAVLPDSMNPTKESWMDFDVFDFAVPGQVIMRMGEALLERHGFVREFDIPTNTLRSFLGLLDSTYLEVPYHNSTHGADVAHVMSYFLLHGNLAQRGDSLLHFASLIAALGHDVGHPGFSNRFLVHTDDALAITFNDKSPLENMHASTLFQILHTHDILQALGKEDKRRFRQFVIEMILATDNAVHAEVMAKIDVMQPADLHVFQASLHAADLSGGGKTVKLSQQWTSKLLEEFYMQGDLERELDLYEVLPVMDRKSTLHRGVFQEAFIKQICIPLYQTLQEKCNLDLTLPLNGFESNAKHWIETAHKHQGHANNDGNSSSNSSGEEEVAERGVVVAAGMDGQAKEPTFELEKLARVVTNLKALDVQPKLAKPVQVVSAAINSKKPPLAKPSPPPIVALPPGTSSSVAVRVAAIASKATSAVVGPKAKPAPPPPKVKKDAV